MISIDLQGKMRQQLNYFYLEKLFDVLADGVLTNGSNKPLYQICGQELD